MTIIKLMLNFLFRKELLHVHDYEMEFEGDGLDYTLRCRCGDVATDMHDALRKMGR